MNFTNLNNCPIIIINSLSNLKLQGKQIPLFLSIKQLQKNRKNSPPNDYKLAVKQKIKHSENNDEKNKKK